MPTLAGIKHLSVQFFFHRPRLFHLSTEKCTCLIRQKWPSKWLFPRRHKNEKPKRSKRFSVRGNNLKNATKLTKIHYKNTYNCWIDFIFTCDH